MHYTIMPYISSISFLVSVKAHPVLLWSGQSLLLLRSSCCMTFHAQSCSQHFENTLALPTGRTPLGFLLHLHPKPSNSSTSTFAMLSSSTPQMLPSPSSAAVSMNSLSLSPDRLFCHISLQLQLKWFCFYGYVLLTEQSNNFHCEISIHTYKVLDYILYPLPYH